MKISIGPIPYFWPREKVLAFYGQLRDAPVDIVYLGETVCAKRRELDFADWVEIADQLTAAGKQTVLSTLTLLEAESELAALKRIVENGRYPVEANDVAALRLLADGKRFVIGPHINAYNSETLALLRELGASRWVVPVELGKRTIAALLADRPPGMETELFAYGRLPLAFSARCFSARAHNTPKDSCGFVCRDYPDGLTLSAQDQVPFLVINGVQIQSALIQNLITRHHELMTLGIDIIRIAPRAEGMNEIINIARDVLDGRLQPPAGSELLAPYQGDGYCDGYWEGRAGMSLDSGSGLGTRFSGKV